MNEENDPLEPVLPPNDTPPLGIGPRGSIVSRDLHGGAAQSAEAAVPQTSVPSRIELPPVGRWQGDDEPGHEAAEPADATAQPPSHAAQTNGYGEPASDSYDYGLPTPSPGAAPENDAELDLFSHLAELRVRILRAFAAIGICMIGTWSFKVPIMLWFAAPIKKEVEHAHGRLITITPMEGFSMYLTITFIAAVLIAIPFVLYQLWAFVEPALTHNERKYSMVLVPFSVFLFFLGAGLGFLLTPLFFRFFLQFQPPGSLPTWRYTDAATFLGKMLLCFGICFQVPVVTVFLNKTGIVSRNWMIEYWRHVVIAMFIVVSIITPTWDPATLIVAATPPCLLYGFSIWLVKWLP